ncbi:hypothetical protein N646_4394 [Vibrio alginolyticus NBRC 15630 = ATCC 17749]|uniref:Uncharacterized protein n=1 Tax=Vibrio alginolyticus (strain ATCC 17749 / DSM 2171 / NBRC 15630 / NCIMB 1903 / NCTC 12160 / XII-53) TaxID=1219076 RepID=A0A2I3CRE2_VIBAX|nr:hypothetical protein N646_4394 [Vibrio alginolyticus NBRC 15630 = ATCC 17749]
MAGYLIRKREEHCKNAVSKAILKSKLRLVIVQTSLKGQFRVNPP